MRLQYLNNSVSSHRSCSTRSLPSVEATYIFLPWLFFVMASAKITMPCPYSLHLELRAARVVPESSFIFRHATEGDLPGIIELFKSGQASAYDVDQSNGSSALVVSCKCILEVCVDPNSNAPQYAVDRGHVAVWRYLLSAGADRCLTGKSKQ